MSEVGRPRIFKTPKELEEKIASYFAGLESDKITITGLCLSLGINKDTFYEYGKKKEFKDIIDYARLKVENSYELSLRKYGRTGDIFALKNFGWKDKQDIDANVNTEIKVTLDD